jgi:hypothetical protein
MGMPPRAPRLLPRDAAASKTAIVAGGALVGIGVVFMAALVALEPKASDTYIRHALLGLAVALPLLGITAELGFFGLGGFFTNVLLVTGGTALEYAIWQLLLRMDAQAGQAFFITVMLCNIAFGFIVQLWVSRNRQAIKDAIIELAQARDTEDD